MPTIRLIREVTVLSGRGPGNGQYALQRLLRAEAVPWLAIGGELQSGEIPWVWSWEDELIALRRAIRREPFILGPNVLFGDSANPCKRIEEKLLCEAPSCRLLFTESAWYADLIRGQLGPDAQTPISIWSYPIHPIPDPPLALKWDVLIYLKSGCRGGLLRQIKQAWPNHVLLTYGHFQREELWNAARQSRCAFYLSDDDRGPLALAEILLCGCPAIGVAKGAPWVIDGDNGATIPAFRIENLYQAVKQCEGISRETVRAGAIDRFGGGWTVATILDALRPVAAE